MCLLGVSGQDQMGNDNGNVVVESVTPLTKRWVQTGSRRLQLIGFCLFAHLFAGQVHSGKEGHGQAEKSVCSSGSGSTKAIARPAGDCT